jgi:hypothetical protein
MDMMKENFSGVVEDCSSETPVITYRTAFYYNPGDKQMKYSG